jgi:MSHA pilin protein MshB
VLQGAAPSVGTATGNDYVTRASGTQCTFTYQAEGGNDSIQYNANTGSVTYTFQ